MYIIFSDVDKTMIDGNLVLLDETMKDIDKARSKGILFAICTGNSHHENMTKLAERVNADFLVTSDGARVFNRNLKKIIYKKMIGQKIANNILQEIRYNFLYVSWSTEKGHHISVENETNKKIAVKTNRKYNCKSGNFIFENSVKGDIYKMSCFGMKEKVHQAEAIIKKYDVSYLRHSENFLTISAINSSKGKAVIATSEINKVNLEDIMVVGDGINDLSMAKVTPNSYAVANAVKSLKQISKRHTSSVDQNGLGEAIIDFMFRKKVT